MYVQICKTTNKMTERFKIIVTRLKYLLYETNNVLI